ncbi:MFS transporter [Promicromonospora thailandica]|uniref:Arabinose efflux permease, MFS family n=2 Tax=Promicromonospora thailandica TaxID=765201 RepID=A0A9X2G998_9MICO|nr:putative arabinose efflux permease, MFS family [Promicromonospora thailandica]
MQSARSVAGFWILAALFLVAVASSAVPSPLYPIYAQAWGLTPFELTVVFAAYMLGILVSVLVAGRLSDHVGRRPVLVVGTLGIVLSHVLLAAADGFGALVTGRLEQGLAVGVTLGALGAALIDNAPVKNPALASTLNAALPAFALATGSLASGALVEWAPAPQQLVYIVFGSLLVLLTLALFVVPDGAVRRPGALRSLRPAVFVPSGSRTIFRDSAGSIVAAWAIGGLFLSLVPSALLADFDISNHFTAGVLIAVVTATGGLTALLLQRTDARRALLVGLVALILGSALTVASFLTHFLPGVVAAAVIAGVGFGAGFQAPVRLVLATAPATDRAGLISAIYVVSYVAYGLPALVAGLLVPAFGLPAVIAGYGVFVALAASVALALQSGSRTRQVITTVP